MGFLGLARGGITDFWEAKDRFNYRQKRKSRNFGGKSQRAGVANLGCGKIPSRNL
jgi:hypothetical protein